MPTTEHTEIPIIDREQFDMLIATGEDEAASMLNELLELYTTEAEPKLKELHMMAALVDRHRCNRIAHALAGASANLGGMRLAAFCRAYENSAQTQTPLQLKEGATRIESTYHATVAEMRAEIAKLG
jgi:HPt (histidine-containing phosphotransfer) domain-containing protein